MVIVSSLDWEKFIISSGIIIIRFDVEFDVNSEMIYQIDDGNCMKKNYPKFVFTIICILHQI